MSGFRHRKGLVPKLAAALALCAVATAGLAQAAGEELSGLSKRQLRVELRARHDAALALSRDASVVAANDPRFIWANEAKAQCGIALGWLKSATRDALSIAKCADAYARMQPLPMALAPPPAGEAER